MPSGLLGEGGPGLDNSIGSLLGEWPWSAKFHWGSPWAVACLSPLCGIGLGPGSSIWKSPWGVAVEWPMPPGVCLGTTLGVGNSIGNLLGEGGVSSIEQFRWGVEPWTAQFHWEFVWGWWPWTGQFHWDTGGWRWRGQFHWEFAWAVPLGWPLQLGIFFRSGALN